MSKRKTELSETALAGPMALRHGSVDCVVPVTPQFAAGADTSAYPQGKGRSRVLVVDDHPATRRGLRCFIDAQPDLTVCGEAADARGAIETAASMTPDVAVIDIALGSDDGLELLKEFARRWPAVVTVGYSALEETVFAERAMRAGARGFVSKAADATQLIDAIRRALRGDVALSESASSAILRRLRGGGGVGGAGNGRGGALRMREGGGYSVDQLSDRELQVFILIGQGFSSAEIADRLFISVKTVESYREHIKQKLNIESRGELLRNAIRFASRNPA